MKEVGRVVFTMGPSLTRNQQWRQTEAAHSQMMEMLNEAERRWDASPKDVDSLRFACTDTLISVTKFMNTLGLSQFAQDRLEELMWSFARANWGQETPLLARAKMRPSLSPIDRMYQGAAQACVEMYTAAAVPVGEARKRTARQFKLKKVRGLGVETLAKLGSRLSGRAAKRDPNFDYYRMAADFARVELKRRGGIWPPTESQAENVVKAIVRRTINQDKAPKSYSSSR